MKPRWRSRQTANEKLQLCALIRIAEKSRCSIGDNLVGRGRGQASLLEELGEFGAATLQPDELASSIVNLILDGLVHSIRSWNAKRPDRA